MPICCVTNNSLYNQAIHDWGVKMRFYYDSFSLRTTLQLCALTTILISSFFLVRGTMSLSVNDIAKLSGTYFGHNPNLLKSLCAQKVDYSVGWIFLLLSFLLQTWNLLWPMRINDFGINKVGFVVGVFISILILCTGLLLAKTWRNSEIKKAETILENEK